MTLPDQNTINIEVAALAEEARETIQIQIIAVPPSAGVIAPIYMGKDHEVIPDSYVLHYTIATCANCTAESRSNDFYALSYIRSRINGTRVRHLVRCERPLFNLPVARIPVGTKRVPFCCECPEISLDHLPPPPHESRLYDLADPILRGAKPKSTGEPKPAKKPASLDDLI